MDHPVFVYDDDCGFCTWWADLFDEHTDLQLVGFSDLEAPLRDRLPEEYRQCSHLVTIDRVYSCGASIEEAICRTRVGRILRPIVSPLRRLGPYRALREWVYRRGANNRDFWGRLLSKTPPARQHSD